MDIRVKLIRMLLEDTGVNILDSGGKDGRYWQRNQRIGHTIKDWEALPEIEIVDVDENSISIIRNIYHWLKEVLYVTPESEYWEEEFYKWEKTQDSDYGYLDLLRIFFRKRFGDYEEGNTYNYDSSLSQAFDWVYNDDEEIIAIRIHNGCDIRGGYTKPRFFKADDWRFMLYGDFVIKCEKCGKMWEGYEGYYIDDKNPIFIDMDVYEETGKLIHKGCGGELKIY